MAFWRDLGVKEQPIGGFRGLFESVSPTARPLGVLSAVSNLIIDKEPALSTRTGLTAVGSAGSGVVNGLYEYHNLAGTNVHPVRHVGTALEKWTGSSWSSVGSGLTDGPSTAAMLNNVLCIFHGGTPRQYNGSSLSNLSGAPSGKYVCEAHEQLFVTGISGREGDIDFCDVASPMTWRPTPTNDAGSITMSVYPGKWIAHDKIRDKVLFWTTHGLHMLVGPETPNRPDLWENRFVASYGTPNGRTVQNMGGIWVWLTRNADKQGFAFWGGGGEPDVQYEPIKDSFALIDWTQIDKAASYIDERGRYVCDCPKVGGGNLRFVYDQAHGWFTFTGPAMRSYARLTLNGAQVACVGDDSGYVYKLEGTTDNGTEITWSVEIGPSVLGDAFEQKQLLHLVVVMSKASGATAQLALSTAETGTYETAVTLSPGTTMNYQEVPLPLTQGGSRMSNVFRLRISGTGVVTIHDLLIKYRTIGR